MTNFVDSKEINKNNLLIKLLGDNESKNRLELFTDDDCEKIGNFNKVKKIADEIDEHSKDYTIKWGDLLTETIIKELPDGMTYDNLSLAFKENKYDRDCVNLLFSNHGLQSFCNAVGVPTTYIKKCMSEEECDFATENLNFWLNKIENKEREAFIRTTDDRVHGVLSNRYSVFDDHEVLEIIDGTLGNYSDEYTVKNHYITPEIMKLRLVSRDKIELNGRPVSFGFDIKNSRVGRSSLELEILIFDWICSNGMIFGGGKGLAYKRRHVGINREIFIEEFIDMINSAPDIIKFIEKMATEAHQTEINNEMIQRYIDKFRIEGFSQLAAGKVEQMLHEKYDNTLYGFTAAITESAQDYDVDTRERMEKFAGNLMVKELKLTA